MKILLNCDVDWAWRMWGESPFLDELSKQHEPIIFCDKNIKTEYTKISLPTDLRKYHHKHDIPDDKKKDILEFLKKILKEIDVVLLASAGERFVNLELIKLCKEMGKKSVFMVEGLNNADYGIPVWPDKIFVWGKVMRDLFIENVKNTGSCPPDILEITGQPRFDNFYEIARPRKAYKVVMVAPPFYSSSYAEETADLIMGGLRNFKTPDLLMVHPHPSIGTNLYRDTNKKYRKDGFYVSKGSLREFWQLADVCVTSASTIAIEAMCFDIPVVIADKRGIIKTQRHFRHLLKSGSYLYAQTHEDVENAVNWSLQNPQEKSKERQKMVKDYFCAFDGKSSQRCVRAIKKL